MQFQRLVLPFANKSRHAALLALAPLPAPRAPALRRGRAQATTRKTEPTELPPARNITRANTARGFGEVSAAETKPGKRSDQIEPEFPVVVCQIPAAENPTRLVRYNCIENNRVWQLGAPKHKKRHLRAPSAALVFACSQNEPKRGDEARKAAFLSAILWCYPCFLFSAENLLTPHSPKNQPIFRFQPWPNGVETGEILL